MKRLVAILALAFFVAGPGTARAREAWDSLKEGIETSSAHVEHCIGCGVCVYACPVEALYH